MFYFYYYSLKFLLHCFCRMYGLFQTTFYFGYMALFSAALGVMCGKCPSVRLKPNRWKKKLLVKLLLLEYSVNFKKGNLVFFFRIFVNQLSLILQGFNEITLLFFFLGPLSLLIGCLILPPVHLCIF